LDIDDGLGGRQLAAQPRVLLGELGHAPGFGEGGVGFAPALLWFKPRAFGRRALLAPRGQLRGVDALAAQQRPDLTDCGAAVRSGQDPALVVTGELSPFRGGRHFRVGRRRREG